MSFALVLLLQVANVPAGGTAVQAPAADEKICRRIEVTGSLVRKERVCRSRSEWMRRAENGNGVARALVETSTGRPWGY